MTSLRTLLAAVALCAAAVTPALSADVTMKMLNSGPGGMMVFDPPFVKIAPGDSVTFVATDKGHNVETIKGMAPEGATPIKTVVGKDETVKFEKEGVYGVKCAPHYIMGMVGLIVVGTKLDNLEAAKAVQHGKLAAKRFEPLFAQAEGK